MTSQFRESKERAQEIEHAAWVHLCDRLREEGVDPNKTDALIGAIRGWGQTLVRLHIAEEREK